MKATTDLLLLGAILAGAMLPVACDAPKPEQKKTPDLVMESQDSLVESEEKLQPFPPEATVTLNQLEPKLTQPVDKVYARQLPTGGQEALDEGRELREKGNLSKAIEKLERAKGFDPNNPTVAKQLGLTYAKLPNYGKALTNLEVAAEYFGNDADMQVLLGRIAVIMKDPAEAQRRFRLALLCQNANPENKNAAHAVLFLGRLLEQQGYWTAALECFTKLEQWTREQNALYQSDDTLKDIVMKPEDLIAIRGRLLAMLRRNDEAVTVLRRAYRRNRSDSTTAQLLVGSLVASGKFDQAEKLLVELAGQPVHGTIVPVLAMRLCVKSGDKGMPARIIKAYREKHAVSAEMALSLARAAMMLKAPAQAEEILQDLIREMPGNVQAVAMLAAISTRQGNFDKALRLLAELIEKNPQTTEAVNVGVKTILAATPPPPADLLNTFSQATYKDTGKNKFALHYVAGVFAEQNGKELLAADHFKRAIEDKKDFHPAYEALLSLQLQSGANDEVNQILEEIKKQAKQGYYYYYLLGKTRLQQRDVVKAINAFMISYEKNSSYLPTVLELARAYQLEAEKFRTSSRGKMFFERSQDMYVKALELDPQRVLTYRAAFDQAVSWRDLESAKDIAQSLMRELPKSPDGLIMAAELFVVEGNFRQADSILGQLANQFPGRVEIPLLAILAEINRYPGVLPKVVYERSIKRLQFVLEKFPGNLQARRMLADLYGRPVPGELTKAAEVWGKIHDEFPRDELFTRTYIASLLQAKQYALAKKLLEELLDKTPADANLRRMKLDVLVQMGKTDEAIVLARQWWDKSGKTAQGQSGFQWLGLLLDLYEQDKQFGQAVKLLDELLKDTPDISTEALEGRKIGLLVKAGRYDEAIALALESKSAFPAQKLAYDLVSDGKYSLAITLLDNRIAIIQEKITAGQNPATQPAASSQPASQPAESQPALEDKPAEQKATPASKTTAEARKKYEDELAVLKQLKIMAQLKADPSDMTPALKWVNEQLKEDPTAKGPRQMLVSSLVEAGQFQQALKIVDGWITDLSETEPRITGAVPTLLWCRETAVSLLIAAGKPAEALARCDKYLANNPNNSEFYNLKASALGELGKRAESLKALRRAQALKPDDSSLCNNLAYSLAESGEDLPQAEKLIETCLKQVGKYNQIPTAFLDTKAWVLYKEGRFSEAGGIFLRILPEEPDESDLQKPAAAGHAVLWDHAGDVFYRLGWNKQALWYWQQALASAKEEKNVTREIQVVLDNTPKKIADVEADKKVQIAPLSNVLERRIKELKNQANTQEQELPAEQLETPETQEMEEDGE